MQLSGYISDQHCPADPSHGETHYMAPGHYCPHHGHDMPAATKNWWTEDEWQAVKVVGDAAPPTRKIALRKRPTRRSKR